MNKLNVIWFIWKSISVSLHAIGTVFYGYAIVYQAFNPEQAFNQKSMSMLGDIKYMTYWDLLFQFIFNTSSLVIDIIPKRKLSLRFIRIVDTFFHTVAFPFAMFVCISFWILCSVDVNLVRNPIIVKRYPNWYNHVTHTMIGPMNVMELLVTHHSEPNTKHGIMIIMFLYMTYFFWVLFLGLSVDIWVYPFLEMLNWVQRVMFAFVCGISLLFYYTGCVFISKQFWPNSRIKAFKEGFDQKPN